MYHQFYINMGSHIPLIYLFVAAKWHHQIKSGGMRETGKNELMAISIFEQFSVLLLVIIMEVPFLVVKIILETKAMIYSLFFRYHKKRNGVKKVKSAL